MTNLLDKFRKEHNLDSPETDKYKYFRRVSMDDFIKRCNELKDRLSLSRQEIEDAIHSACDFFGIAYPMLIIDLSNKKYGQTMFVNTDPVSFNDDVICYSIQQLQELQRIFFFNVEKAQYKITQEAYNAVLEKIRQKIAEHDKHFGNARYVRNLFESVIQHQANRVSAIPNPTREQLSVIEVGDVI